MATPGPGGGAVHAPPIEDHRLLGGGSSAALILPDATIDWWCSPAFDSPPLLWWLLDADGSAARWTGARALHRDERPAGPSARSMIEIADRRIECWDGLIDDADGDGGPVRPAGAGAGRARRDRPRTGGRRLRRAACRAMGRRGDERRGSTVNVAGGVSTPSGKKLLTTVDADPGRRHGLSVGVNRDAVGDPDQMVELLSVAEDRIERLLRTARLPRHHPERARDALLVLDASTSRASGAVVASPTTSLPEAPGGSAQWDDRYTWLRDASLAVSVGALLGQRAAAERYLEFVHHMTKGGNVPSGPMTDVRGGTVPSEREVDVRGWAGSRPVRVGNDAADQCSTTGLGLLIQGISVYVQTGGSLDDTTWKLVKAVADAVSGDVEEKTDGKAPPATRVPTDPRPRTR